MRAWVLGYLAGRAIQSNIDVLKNTDSTALMSWMDTHCKATPLEGVSQAADVLYDELGVKSGHILVPNP
jgi:hypothetical protein